MMNTAVFRSYRLLSPSVVRRSFSAEPSKVEYVHPLSQIVLEYLQKERSEWVVSQGLDQGLTVHRDGTFLIKFPSYEKDMARIWTSYDVEEKKHWLTVHKGDLVGRFLLQDNLRPAWNDNRSTPEKIQSAVDVMIEKIDEYNRSRGIEPQLNNDGK